MLSNLPDLIVDIPEATVWLGSFIGRAIADDCIPPKYVTNPENPDKLNEYALQSIKRADALLSLKQGWAHLDNIWGSAGPLRPVKNITKQMTLLLKEYLSSRDFVEAQRCLRALEVPHYHHELVYEAIVMALESLSQQTEEAMCTLLKLMEECCLISPAQIESVRKNKIIVDLNTKHQNKSAAEKMQLKIIAHTTMYIFNRTFCCFRRFGSTIFCCFLFFTFFFSFLYTGLSACL